MAQAIELIQASNGLTENITLRKIAEKSNVGLGLINHYFGTKENLIEACVQRIISGVIGTFRPDLEDSEDCVETTKRVAKQVMDFLMDHPEISKISILGDLKQPQERDNTMSTVYGFGRRLSGGSMQRTHMIHSFMITAVMQVAFLRRDLLLSTLGLDLYDKAQRDAFIDDLIERFRYYAVSGRQWKPAQGEHMEAGACGNGVHPQGGPGGGV